MTTMMTTMTMTTNKTPKPLRPTFLAPEVNDYVIKVGYNESPISKALRLATAKHPHGRLMFGPAEAAMFQVLLPAIGAKRVVEVGVFTGYSTMIMAKSIDSSGTVYALDISDEYVNEIGRRYWDQENVTDRIDLRIAPAAETLESLLEDDDVGPDSIDFAFIDADKVNYKTYYELLLPLIRQNGIIAFDNVLWGGKVWDTQTYDDEITLALRDISEHVKNDTRVEHVMLPLSDGVTLVRKK